MGQTIRIVGAISCVLMCVGCGASYQYRTVDTVYAIPGPEGDEIAPPPDHGIEIRYVGRAEVEVAEASASRLVFDLRTVNQGAGILDLDPGRVRLMDAQGRWWGAMASGSPDETRTGPGAQRAQQLAFEVPSSFDLAEQPQWTVEIPYDFDEIPRLCRVDLQRERIVDPVRPGPHPYSYPYRVRRSYRFYRPYDPFYWDYDPYPRFGFRGVFRFDD